MAEMTVDTFTSPYKVLHVVQKRIARIEFWENNIVYIDIKDNEEIELADAKEHYEVIKARYDGKNKFLVLANPGQYTSITKEAREFSALPESNEMSLAVAVVIKSLSQRMILNFITLFVKLQPVKFKNDATWISLLGVDCGPLLRIMQWQQLNSRI